MLEVFVWTWSLGWWLAEDAAKVLCRMIVTKYNIFDINNAGVMVLTAYHCINTAYCVVYAKLLSQC